MCGGRRAYIARSQKCARNVQAHRQGIRGVGQSKLLPAVSPLHTGSVAGWVMGGLITQQYDWEQRGLLAPACVAAWLHSLHRIVSTIRSLSQHVTAASSTTTHDPSVSLDCDQLCVCTLFLCCRNCVCCAGAAGWAVVHSSAAAQCPHDKCWRHGAGADVGGCCVNESDVWD